MKKSSPINQPYHWLLATLIIAFVLLKLEALSLPFFWDEAWVYMPAIRTMAEQGPSIMPASIDPNLYTGHPLLFYFLASAWIKYLGYSLITAHLFPLIISILLLLSVYYITYKWTNSFFSAFVATLLVVIQPIFLAQSTHLLIEVWLSLLFIWSFYFYFNRNWIAFSIILIMALWSKESAFCLVPAFVLISIIELLLNNITKKQFFITCLNLIAIFFIGFSFFIIQKIKLGWYFFPRHANWITMADFTDKMSSSFLILFISQGRNIIYAFTFILSIVSIIFLKNKLPKTHLIKLLSFLIITIGFMLFASINFFSTRYLFAVIPLLLMGCTFIIGSISKSFYPIIIIPILAVVGFINIYRSTENTGFGDCELNYTRLLKVQVEMVDYLKKSDLKEKIYAPFLMYCILDNPFDGFVESKFASIGSTISDSDNVYYINVSNERLNELDSLKANNIVTLVKKIEQKQALIELYKKTETNN